MDSLDSKSWRHWVGIAFLTAQLFVIAYARFTPERFFAWASYDEHSRYTIDVQINGASLSADEISARYRYSAQGWEPRAIHNVISLVRQYEMTYGESEKAKVTIHYAVNGQPPEIWTWPES